MSYRNPTGNKYFSNRSDFQRLQNDLVSASKVAIEKEQGVEKAIPQTPKVEDKQSYKVGTFAHQTIDPESYKKWQEGQEGTQAYINNQAVSDVNQVVDLAKASGVSRAKSPLNMLGVSRKSSPFNCWTKAGYIRKPGTEKLAPGSCYKPDKK